MEERCENCGFYHPLKHNFERGKGFTLSGCCSVWVEQEIAKKLEDPEYTESRTAWVQEVAGDGMCEMFCERKDY